MNFDASKNTMSSTFILKCPVFVNSVFHDAKYVLFEQIAPLKGPFIHISKDRSREIILPDTTIRLILLSRSVFLTKSVTYSVKVIFILIKDMCSCVSMKIYST